MQSHKEISSGRTHSVLHEAISQFLQKEANPVPLITVTFVQRNKTGHTVTAYCSVLPHEKTEEALAFLKRKERQCQNYIKKKTSLRIIPTVRFAIAKDTMHG